MTITTLCSIWAKSSSAEGHFLSLLAHMIDTAAVARELLLREPYSTLELFSQDLGVDAAHASNLVAGLCGLHDLGKASPVFQIKWEEGAARVKSAGFPFPKLWRTDLKGTPHQLVTYITLREILQGLGWSEILARGVAEALGSHHGFRPQPTRSSPRVIGRGPWEDARKELVNILLSVTGAGKALLKESLSGGGFMRLAGLVSFSDWIASNELLFPYNRSLSRTEDFFNESLSLASRALNRIGWLPREPLVSHVPVFSKVFRFSSPRPLQLKIQEILERTQEPSLIIIEAPTGEGKTEAAFYSHLKLQERLTHRGMYIGLPTQATGNQMFDRTKRFLEKTSQRETSVDLQLLHGASLLKKEFQEMKIRLDEDPWEGSVTADEWFTAKKRALLSEYGVGTIDQALLAVLNVKHQFVRMWGLGNRTIVLDEVHAYDVYTSTLIENLLSWLRTLGSSVVLMSATLPGKKRGAFVEAFGGNSSALKTRPYPRITMVSSTGKVGEVYGFDVRPQTPVKICSLPLDPERVAKKALEEVKEGGCCLCVVNTIDRAQNLYLLLKKAKEKLGWNDRLLIFHARYPAMRRKELEDKVLRLFGKRGERSHKAILVATQVVEQSLDLDFDVMFSDLAPIDLLLQRAGRLHRHERLRPEKHREPCLYVTGLSEELSELTEKLSNTGISRVYEPYILLRSYGILRETPRFVYPESYDDLIKAVYGDTWVPEPILLSVLEDAEKELHEKEENHRVIAESLAIAEPERFLKTSPSSLKQLEDDDPAIHPHLRALTRLGEPTVEAVVLHRQPDGSVSLDPDEKRLVDLDKPVEGFDEAVHIYLNKVSLSHPVVYHALKDPKNTPKSWSKEPLLRHMRPLVFENGVAELGSWRCEYSDELGIRFSKSESNGG
jgi:CRISPR-associated endonuclease/helicase Cas3